MTNHERSRILAASYAVAWLVSASPHDAEARPVRNTTRTSVTRRVDVNQNVNVRRDIDVDVDYHHPHSDYHPVARAAGVAAAATVTAVAVGTVVSALPPSCTTIVANGIAYQNCAGTWYQPRYSGTQVTYVVVNQP